MPITQEKLKELLHYDPETGLFTRLVKTAQRVNVGDIAGTLSGDGYLYTGVLSKSLKNHRLAFLYMTGSIPEYVDHINGVRTDNRWVNLRPATKRQNQYNQKIRSDNTSGIKGVCWSKPHNKWVARIYVDGKVIGLGTYVDIKEAESAVIEARNKYHGDFARHE